MLDTYKVIATTPAGRKENLRILLPYIYRNTHIIDEYHLWINTELQSDIDYIIYLQDKIPNFIKLIWPRVKPQGSSSVYQFYEYCTEVKTIYIKIDDDICFIEDNAIEELIRFRISYKEYFLVYANIVNNVICSHIHQRLGILPVSEGKCNYDPFCEQGWRSGKVASNIHSYFISNLNKNLLETYKFKKWILSEFERTSINFICWFGKDFEKFNGRLGNNYLDDEQYLSVYQPKQMNRYNIICGTALVVHYAYYTQREYLDNNTNLIDEYRKISFLISHTSNYMNDNIDTSISNIKLTNKVKENQLNKNNIPNIEPLILEAQVPFWSVMIPTYNCANYLVDTLKSVLAQDPGVENMQIEVVDDCSTKDDVETIVKEIGKGRVSFFRHVQNYGAIPTFNTCIQRAKGQWVHILHGDDLVAQGFYSCLRKSLEQQLTVGAAFCRSIFIDQNGQWQSLSSLQRQTSGLLSNWVERIAISQQIETPTIVVKRSVYEQLGGFHLELFHAADWEMWKRIAVHYPVWYEPQPLAYYRLHPASDTSRLIRTGSNVANSRRAIEISESYLPKIIVDEISHKARENYAFAALNIAREMLAIGDIDTVIAQVWESLLCSTSSAVIQSLILLITSTDSQMFLSRLSNYVEEKEEEISNKYRLEILYKALQEKSINKEKLSPKIIIDSVFFQLYQTGIARVWKSILQEWVNNGFAKHITVLDRSNTAPKIPGIRYCTISPYDYSNTDADREMLQQICDEEGTEVFISTYYTTPTTTPSVFLAHDMIPELMGWDLNHPMWREKHQGIKHATAYIAVSENTAHDLVKYFPDIALDSVVVAKNGVDHNTFAVATQEKINQFKIKYGIVKPYFLLVGAGGSYKNSILFFQAFSQLASSYGFDIVCTGSGGVLAPEWRTYTSGSIVHMLQLSDEELATAYSGALALVYPSKYEGFGMPVAEAMACGCPVITCPNASIPEVAGNAAIYVNDNDVEGLVNALCEVQKPSIRKSSIAAGLEQAKQFSWSKMAKTVSSVLIETTLLRLRLRETNLIIFPDWSQLEEVLGLELEQVIKDIATHPNNQSITLLIDTSNIATEQAELFLSSVAMNLLMQEDLNIAEDLEISLVGQMADIQWDALRPRIKARMSLPHENTDAIVQVQAENLPLFS